MRSLKANCDSPGSSGASVSGWRSGAWARSCTGSDLPACERAPTGPWPPSRLMAGCSFRPCSILLRWKNSAVNCLKKPCPNARSESASPADLVPAVMRCLAPHIDRRKQRPPARIRFNFPCQPGERVLALANVVAEDLRGKLPETTRIDAFWNWRAADNPVVGVVGHRDLTAFGGIGPVTERLRQSFIDLVMQRGVEGMVTGYAPARTRRRWRLGRRSDCRSRSLCSPSLAGMLTATRHTSLTNRRGQQVKRH